MKNTIKICILAMIVGGTFAVSSSIYAAEQESKPTKSECASKAASTECAEKFSCETIESDPDKARKCNYDRCVNKRGDVGKDYCTCKYGKDGKDKKMGIPLNTSIPFIGRCLYKESDGSTIGAFPTIVSVASRILVTVIMLVSFVMVVIGGVQRARGEASEGKKMITKVAIGFAMLGLMGAILRLINPNFFK